MPGWSNSDNLFGPSSFVVGEFLGAGCNYTSIQTAINEASAAGRRAVYIRAKSTPYVENLSLLPGVDLVGCSADGRVTGQESLISITGSHSYTGFGNVGISNIEFLGDGISAVITIAPVGGTGTLTLIDCYIGDAFGGIFLQPGLGSTAQAKLYDCESNCVSGFSMNGPGDSYLVISGGIHISPTDGIQAAGGACVITLEECSLNGNNFGIQLATIAGATVNAKNSTITCLPNEAINCTGGSASVNLYHCTVESNAASTNFIDGNITFQHIDLALTGSAINNNAAITNYEDWKPYATTSATAVQPGAFRGTAAFDSTQFTVTNGWVQFTGTVPMVWVDQPASTTVVSNQGNFVTGAGVTLTLPAAPVQGDACLFKDPLGNVYVIQANAGQTLQIANQTSAIGGTATSTLVGDAMELTYYAAGGIWVANSVVGTWNVV